MGSNTSPCPGCGEQGEVVPSVGAGKPRCDNEYCRVKLYESPSTAWDDIPVEES